MIDQYLNLVHQERTMEVLFHKSYPEYISKHLHTNEFKCQCNSHCDANLVNTELVGAFESLRTEYGEPIKVTSGYRCTYHNFSVGGVDRSQHTRGRAIDMIAPDLDRLEEISRKHFNFVKRYETFVHADVRHIK